MVEEYNLETNVVVRRAWKVVKKFGAQPVWDVEVGDPDVTFSPDSENIGLKEISTAVSIENMEIDSAAMLSFKNFQILIRKHKRVN